MTKGQCLVLSCLASEYDGHGRRSTSRFRFDRNGKCLGLQIRRHRTRRHTTVGAAKQTVTITAIVALAKISRGYLFREDWQPYLPTPAFPDFVSSHSAVSTSAAEILKRFTGSDKFGGSYRRAAKVSGVEGKPRPSNDIVLSWATFTDAADEAGMSRRYGGLHFEDADVEGRLLGRRVGSLVWSEAEAYMSGTKKSAASFAEARD